MSVEDHAVYTWSASKLPEGSFGQAVFPSELEGRTRHRHTVERPVAQFLYSGSSLTSLEVHRLDDLETLLRSPDAVVTEVTTERGRQQLEGRVRRYLDQVTIGPHGTLINRAFLNGEVALNADLEALRDQTIAQCLERMEAGRFARHAQLLTLKYGLQSGHLLTNEEAGPHLGVSGERARQLERAALVVLRAAQTPELYKFAPYVPDSLARHWWPEINCPYQLLVGSDFDLRQESVAKRLLPSPVANLVLKFYSNLNELLRKPLNYLPEGSDDTVRQALEPHLPGAPR